MLKKLISSALTIFIFSSHASYGMESEPESKAGFIARQNNTLIKEAGKCDERHSPYSTFKVPLALMAFDSGFFETPNSPVLSFDVEYEKNLQSWYTPERGEELQWRKEQTSASFMKNSVIWVSHQITQNLGTEKFQNYVSILNYGNQDISGTPGQDDGLLNSWLGTSLQISPREQVEFLEKLFANTHDNISKDAHENTKIIMDREEQWGEWKLYGKTGGGRDGWFVGWIEKKGEQPIVFAQYLDMEDPYLDLMGIPTQKTVGFTAKEVAKKHLENFWR